MLPHGDKERNAEKYRKKEVTKFVTSSRKKHIFTLIQREVYTIDVPFQTRVLYSE